MSDGYETPKWLLDIAFPNGYFDPCPIRGRTKGPDGLKIEWPVDKPVFINPPYSGVTKWIERAVGHRGPVAMLLMVDPGAPWWHLYLGKVQSHPHHPKGPVQQVGRSRPKEPARKGRVSDHHARRHGRPKSHEPGGGRSRSRRHARPERLLVVEAVTPAETPKCQRCGHSDSYHGINGIPNGGDCTHRLGSPEKYFNVEGGDFDCDCPAYVRLPRLRGPGGEAVTPAEQEAGK